MGSSLVYEECKNTQSRLVVRLGELGRVIDSVTKACGTIVTTIVKLTGASRPIRSSRC